MQLTEPSREQKLAGEALASTRHYAETICLKHGRPDVFVPAKKKALE